MIVLAYGSELIGQLLSKDTAKRPSCMIGNSVKATHFVTSLKEEKQLLQDIISDNELCAHGKEKNEPSKSFSLVRGI